MLLTDLEGIIKRNLSSDAFSWLQAKIALIKAEEKSIQLNLTFSYLPRLAGKKNIQIETGEADKIDQQLPGFAINDWTTDRLCRVWLLMQIPTDDKDIYIKKINGLFAAAEMNEQVALYSALPVLAYPETWIIRCEEGIRSNIGTILEAIMYHNPFPASYLQQNAWNQLVLKAFFTEKNVNNIFGLWTKANKALSETLNDYVQERIAAHRSVDPQIYKLIEQTNQKI